MPVSLPIAMLIGAGVSTGAQVYQAKKASDQNKRALETSERSDIRNIEAERESQREALAASDRRYNSEAEFRKMAWEQALAENQRRWDAYIKANQGLWNTGNTALSRLAGNLGIASPGAMSAPPSQAPMGPVGSDSAALIPTTGGLTSLAKAAARSPRSSGMGYEPLVTPPMPSALQTMNGMLSLANMAKMSNPPGPQATYLEDAPVTL